MVNNILRVFVVVDSKSPEERNRRGAWDTNRDGQPETDWTMKLKDSRISPTDGAAMALM